MLAVGCDIGGHHIAVGIVDLQNAALVGEILHRPTDRKGTRDYLLDTWCEAIGHALATIPPPECAGVGIAIPGPFDYRTGIAQYEGNDKFETLRGLDVGTELSRRMPQVGPIRFINDASGFAIGAHARLPESQNDRRIVAVTLGTGFGSSFLIDGIPVIDDMLPGVPPDGCLWHLPYRDGIADDTISARWLMGEYRARTGKDIGDVAAMAECARGDGSDGGVFEAFGTHLGAILAPWLREFQPDRLVLGGRIARAFDLFGPALEQGLKAEGTAVPISIHEDTELAAIVGSALTADDAFWTKLKPCLPTR